MRFDDWTGARPWAQDVMRQWRAATASVRQRAAEPLSVADDAIWECLDSGRPFCFLRTLDTVDRVRLRDAWEWRKWAVGQYARIAALAMGGKS